MALFLRGSSRVMFENIYAITPNEAHNQISSKETPYANAFDSDNLSNADSELINRLILERFFEFPFLVEVINSFSASLIQINMIYSYRDDKKHKQSDRQKKSNHI